MPKDDYEVVRLKPEAVPKDYQLQSPRASKDSSSAAQNLQQKTATYRKAASAPASQHDAPDYPQQQRRHRSSSPHAERKRRRQSRSTSLLRRHRGQRASSHRDNECSSGPERDRGHGAQRGQHGQHRTPGQRFKDDNADAESASDVDAGPRDTPPRKFHRVLASFGQPIGKAHDRGHRSEQPGGRPHHADLGLHTVKGRGKGSGKGPGPKGHAFQQGWNRDGQWQEVHTYYCRAGKRQWSHKQNDW